MRSRPALIAVVGACALVLASRSAAPLTLARLAIAGATLGAAAMTDLAEHRIPNRLVLPAAAACAILDAITGIGATTLVGLAAVAVLLLLGLAAPSALGMGDIKLMLVVVLGVEQDAVRALALALSIAVVAAAVLLISKGQQARNRSLPLAPFLAIGTFLAVL